jgi:hypothetical protein
MGRWSPVYLIVALVAIVGMAPGGGGGENMPPPCTCRDTGLVSVFRTHASATPTYDGPTSVAPMWPGGQDIQIHVPDHLAGQEIVFRSHTPHLMGGGGNDELDSSGRVTTFANGEFEVRWKGLPAGKVLTIYVAVRDTLYDEFGEPALTAPMLVTARAVGGRCTAHLRMRFLY